MSKLVRRLLPVAFVLFVGASLSQAQTGLDVYFGAGTAMDSSSGARVDTFGTGAPYTTPRLGGTFGRVGADYMFKPWLGVGAETDWRFSQGAYAGLSYRPLFYDFNVIWMPTASRNKRIVPELQAGIGGTKVSFYENQTYCDAFAGCSSSNTQVESSNHFQTHLSAGIRFYATQHLFVRPQVDAHYVDNFFQFGSNWVPEYGASVGWRFGER